MVIRYQTTLQTLALERDYSYQERLIDRQLKVAVAFETDAFTFKYVCHLVRDAYCD